MENEFVNLLGLVGAGLVLLAFILEQTHKWKDTDFKYDMLNLVGSAMLVGYAFFLSSYPFLVLNGVWALVSLRDVVVGLNKRK